MLIAAQYRLHLVADSRRCPKLATITLLHTLHTPLALLKLVLLMAALVLSFNILSSCNDAKMNKPIVEISRLLNRESRLFIV